MSVKRYEWVACDEHSCHCDVVESAEGDMVDYEDYAALEARCAALAAENTGLIEQAEEVYAAGYNHGHLNTVDGIAYADCVKDDFYGLAVELMREAETPATDAFLAEVRASAVDDACLKISNSIPNCYQDELVGLDMAATICGDFASELRKGVQS